MQLGMIGLGRMGANMVRRLLKAGHQCVVFDRSPKAVEELVKEKARGSLRAAGFREEARQAAGSLVDGPGGRRGRDHRRSLAVSRGRRHPHRRRQFLLRGRHPPRQGTRAEGDSLRGRGHQRRRLGTGTRLLHDDRRPGRGGRAPRPDLQHAGARHGRHPAHSRTREASAAPPSRATCTAALSGAGHFVKMVHNGIEYGIMAAYAEGLGVLRDANIGKQHARDRRRDDAAARPRALPVRPQSARYRGSVAARQRDRLVAAGPDGGRSGQRSRSREFAGRVSDSGEGRWTIKAAIDEAVPVPVLTTALYERFTSRGEADFQDKLLSAMRFEFGGHLEKHSAK